MNAPLLAKVRDLCCVLLLCLSCQYLTAQDIELTFDTSGKLTSKPLPRMKISGCPDKCDNNYHLKARVLLPLDYFKDEKEKIDSTAQRLNTALSDSTSILSRILQCNDSLGLTKINAIVNSQDIHQWAFSEEKQYDDIIPFKLKNYVSFIQMLGSIKNVAGNDQEVGRLLGLLNERKYGEFAPFRFRIKGYQIEDTCIRFTRVTANDNYCRCILPTKKYIAIEFTIPWNVVKNDPELDSFQVVQHFPMKEFAIKRYNALLDASNADLPKLKAIQTFIKDNTKYISKILAAQDTLSNLQVLCADTTKEKVEERNRLLIDSLGNKLDATIGKFDCNTSCATGNALFCTPILANWILKLAWLNGDLIRLNPFNFTNQKIAAGKSTSVTAQALSIYNDSVQLGLWNAGIKKLQDGVKVDNIQDIQSVKDRLKRLILERDSVQKHLDSTFLAKKNAEENKTIINDSSKQNADLMAATLLTSKVKYKGWIVPYAVGSRDEHDRMWLRNYYYQGTSGLKNDEKLKFTYPEDENLTLLVHNLRPGMAIKVTESISPSTDSSEFSIFAAEAIVQATQLYASVQPAAALVRTGLQLVNAPRTVEITAPNIHGKTIVISNVSYTKKLDSMVKAHELLLGDSVNLKINNVAENLTLVGGNIKISDQLGAVIEKLKITKKVNRDTAFQKCYAQYLKSLVAFGAAPDLIDERLKTKEDNIPSYFTYKYALTDSVPTYINKYTLRVAESQKADSAGQYLKAASFIKVAPYRHFYLAAGLAYTPDAGAITSIDTSNGGFKINRDEDRVRVIVGLRYYPFGLYNLKNPSSIFREGRWLHRLSILVATGIPKPLENLYTGVGFDLFPGLTFSGIAHFQLQNNYSIANNQITGRSIQYRPKFSYALTMDPNLFIGAVTSIFK